MARARRNDRGRRRWRRKGSGGGGDGWSARVRRGREEASGGLLLLLLPWGSELRMPWRRWMLTSNPAPAASLETEELF